MFKNFVSLSTIFFLVIATTACRGRDANPVQIIQDRDFRMGCEQLRFELDAIFDQAQKVYRERVNSNVGNAAAVVGGVLFLVPFFMLDLSKAEKVELDALKTRHDHLRSVGKKKKCNMKDVKEIQFKTLPSSPPARKRN